MIGTAAVFLTSWIMARFLVSSFVLIKHISFQANMKPVAEIHLPVHLFKPSHESGHSSRSKATLRGTAADNEETRWEHPDRTTAASVKGSLLPGCHEDIMNSRSSHWFPMGAIYWLYNTCKQAWKGRRGDRKQRRQASK